MIFEMSAFDVELMTVSKSFLINVAFITIYLSRPIFLLSLCILRESLVFDFITCVIFCTEINNA